MMMNQPDEETIYVVTRTGKHELLNTDKITKRLQKLIAMEPKILHVNPYELMLIVCQGIKSGITTAEIDEYAGNAAASLSVRNPYYGQLASRIICDNHQKSTKRSFIDKMKDAYFRTEPNGKINPLLSEKFYKYVQEHQNLIEPLIDYKRDFLLDFFGFRTFQKLYSIKINGKCIERPQDTFIRSAIMIHMDTCPDIKEEIKRIATHYNMLSNKFLTQASPTYFNSGSNHPQLSSCFLLGTEDSREGIMRTADESSVISKWGGGIGIHVSCWRGTGSRIYGTNGQSSGIVPFLRIYNNVMRAFNQGGKRLGSAAIYLMPHHPDIKKFLQLKLEHGDELERARDLFYAVWIPDLFMERVRSGEKWSLFDPNDTVDLSDYYGDNYRNKYLELEQAQRYTEQVDARSLWQLIYKSNMQKGVPYICFSDTVNRLSNQSNIGTIKSSNLCAEIMEYSDHEETAVCNLCSVSLSKCVIDHYTDEELKLAEQDRRELNHDFPINPKFDFEHLLSVVKIATRNLNNIIDKNYYPSENTKRSNLRHRPIGIGFQGLADTFCKMRYPFESKEAADLNKRIAETMYYAALTQSTLLSKERWQYYMTELANVKAEMKLFVEEHGEVDSKAITDFEKRIADLEQRVNDKRSGSYASMLLNGGSPISKGIFHWELAGKTSDDLSGMYDWETLRQHIKIYGVRNSLLIALMPTASTSQLLGNNECFEPYTSNIYRRKTLAGDFLTINKYLIHDLYRMGFWNEKIRDYIKTFEGSIQGIVDLPEELRMLYKTTWEIDQETLIKLAADRQVFIDQSQSLNLYEESLTYERFTKLMFKAWRQGLKTGNYYFHTRPAVMPQKFTLDPNKQKEMQEILNREKKLRDTSFLTEIKNQCDLCGA